ncbi:MAG: glycosyltransferase family 4 protein [Verrucomicrobia bacterium]|nr:glycosyltransferase family 4 protein [Verrucomicrobiota bacterium]
MVVLNDFRNDSRVEKISRSLAHRGLDVKVFATAGKNLPVTEIKDGYQVIRPFRTRRNIRSFGRVVSSLGILISLVSKIFKIDLVHCNDLEPLPFCLFLKILSFGRIKVIYDAHELETEKNSTSAIRKSISRLLESLLIGMVDSFVTVSPSIAKWYEREYLIKRPVVVLNCPYYREPVKTNLLRGALGIEEDKKIILYQGGFAENRGLRQLLEAFESADAPSDCVLVFLGFGPVHRVGLGFEDKIRNASNRNSNVFFHPAVPYGELIDYTSSADLGLCLIEGNCLSYRYSLPNKLFEYGMAGLPMMVSDLPEMRAMVEKFECGMICDRLTSEGILSSIASIFQADLGMLSQNAQKLAKKHCWENQEANLNQAYARLIEGVR